MASAQLSPKMLEELQYAARNGFQGSLAYGGQKTENALDARDLITWDHNVTDKDGDPWLYPVLTPAGWALVKERFGTERPADEGRWTLEECFSSDGWATIGVENFEHTETPKTPVRNLSPAMAVALRTFSRNNGWQSLGTGIRVGTIVALMNRGLIEYGQHNGEKGHYLTPAGWALFLTGRPDNATGRWTLEQCFSEEGWHQVGTQELAHQMAQRLDVNQALCEVMRLAYSDEEQSAMAEGWLLGGSADESVECECGRTWPTSTAMIDAGHSDFLCGSDAGTDFRPAEGDFIELTWKSVSSTGFRAKTTGYIDGPQRLESISYRLPSDGKPGTSYSSVYRHVVTVRVLATVEEQRRPDRLTEAQALELAYPDQRPFLFDWQPGNYSGYRATVNGSEVASLVWKSRKTDPNYVISTPLPAYIPASMRGDDDRLKAQRMAEDLITIWLNSIGAQWKPAELTELPGDITGELEVLAGEAEHGGWSGLQRGPGKRAADAILSAVNRLRGGR